MLRVNRPSYKDLLSCQKIDLEDILQYKLLPVPVSLAEMSGCLHTEAKAMLADELKKGINCPSTVTLAGQGLPNS